MQRAAISDMGSFLANKMKIRSESTCKSIELQAHHLNRSSSNKIPLTAYHKSTSLVYTSNINQVIL